MYRGALKCREDPEILGGLALHPSTRVEVVVVLHIVKVPLVLTLPCRVAVLQVGVDVQIVIHGIRLIWLFFSWKVALKLLQFVWGEEVLFRKDNLEKSKSHRHLGPVHSNIICLALSEADNQNK